jgi:outer membrane protein OmpA-like peptidoglycan-associated protein
MALAFAFPAMSQTNTSTASSAGDYYSQYDISIFGGAQIFQLYAGSDARVWYFDKGPIFGFRLTQDLWNYFGLEEGLSFAGNPLELQPYMTNTWVRANEHNFQLNANGLLYFTKRESKIRPFATAGAAMVIFDPLGNSVSTPQFPTPEYLHTRWGPGLSYGLGVKFNVSRRVGFRLDARGLYAERPSFGLNSVPAAPGALYSNRVHNASALQLEAGVTFRWGIKSDFVPPPPPPPPPPPAPPAVAVRVAPILGAHDVCPGETVALTTSASGWPSGLTPQYQWSVNGNPAPGATGSSFSLPTQSVSGAQNVTVRVSVPGAADGHGGTTTATGSADTTVTILPYSPPTVNFSVSPSTIPYGGRVPVSATANTSQCGVSSTLRYSASEGAVANGSFDSSGVRFDMSNRSKLQTRVVTLTATATDQKGGTGSANANVTVTLQPAARRLDDIVYPLDSSRVNNCAKRLLLEQLTPMLRDDPNAKVVLIGHRDIHEKGKAASKLDVQRVLNAAAVLSAGTGICPQLELSRISMAAVGTDQSSPTQASFCGTSTDVKEKSGQVVKSSDKNAPFRRVEIWFVPGGADMPAGIPATQSLPASDVKKLGCPK